MPGIERRSVCSGVNFRSIFDSRFKTMRMSVHFFLPLEKSTAAPNAILPFLLTRASRKYPDFTKLNEHLADLYGANLDADVGKLGDCQVLSVSASGIADRYSLQGENISGELSRLLCSILFDPPFVDGMFQKDGFEQEKRQLMEQIDSEYNDKRLYALRRCEETMCAGEPFGISRCGTKEEISALDLPELTKYWSRMLHEAHVEILVLGDCDPNPVFEDFSAAFSGIGRVADPACVTKTVASAEKETDLTEKMEVEQSKLVLGFRTSCAEPQEEVPAMKLMCSLYGGSPNSRLFWNVREKLSLCYYCSSSYNPLKGIMMVQSGVETKNIEKAKKEILAQLEDIRNGDFTDDELEAARLNLCNSYRTLSDSLEGMEAWYMLQSFTHPVRKPEEEADIVMTVTRAQIIQTAGRVTLDTVYCLEGNGGVADE